MKKSSLIALAATLMVVSGCGPNLTGTFTGTHTQNGGVSGYQVFTTNLTLNQDGDQLTGQILSQPQNNTTGSTGGTSYPYGGYNNTYSMGPVNGTIQGTVDGDIVKDVRLTVYQNNGYSMCPVQYLGNFTISDGERLQGMLMQSVTASSSGKSGSGSTTTSDPCAQTANTMYGVSSSNFDVRKSN